jgi:hypothetical protein
LITFLVDPSLASAFWGATSLLAGWYAAESQWGLAGGFAVAAMLFAPPAW